MIKIENRYVQGLEEAARGMRNSWNSWDQGDNGGEKDQKLMLKLCKAGPSHAKFRRMIVCWMDITAPLYWWKEFDTYKVGTVANSCSTMHTICDKEFEPDDFSHEYLDEASPVDLGLYVPSLFLSAIIKMLNQFRNLYLQTNDKKYWYSIIQMLPSSYNQKRTVMLNYEVLANIYEQRKNHKLDEWREFCEELEYFPLRWFIIGDQNGESQT